MPEARLARTRAAYPPLNTNYTVPTGGNMCASRDHELHRMAYDITNKRRVCRKGCGYSLDPDLRETVGEHA